MTQPASARPLAPGVDKNALHEALQQRAQTLRAEVDGHRARLREADAATSNTFVAGNEGAVIDAEDSLEVALWQRAEAELEEVEAAMARLHSGSYGHCDRCGEPVGQARLTARPEARLCLACQTQAERG